MAAAQVQTPVAHLSRQEFSRDAHLLDFCGRSRSVLGILHLGEGCQLKCLHQGGQDPLSIVLAHLKPLLGPAQQMLKLTPSLKRCKASRDQCHGIQPRPQAARMASCGSCWLSAVPSELFELWTWCCLAPAEHIFLRPITDAAVNDNARPPNQVDPDPLTAA